MVVKDKIKTIFIITVIIVMVMSIGYSVMRKYEEKEMVSILNMKDKRLDSMVEAERISEKHLELLNIGGSGIKNYLEKNKTNYRPDYYQELFKGIGESGFNQGYVKYEVKDKKSRVEIKDNGEEHIDVRMVVEISGRNNIYRVKVIDGQIQSIENIGEIKKVL